MKERLQKVISARGLASRRRAEELISAGKVTVNGAVAALGDSADPETDEILVDGQRLPEKRRASRHFPWQRQRDLQRRHTSFR